MRKISALVILVILTICLSATPVMAKGKITTWHVPGDFATIQDAVDSAQVSNGDRILVDAGNYAGAILDRPLVIKGTDGTIINSGVPYKAGSSLLTAFRLDEGADGAEVSHFTIPNDTASYYFFAIFARNVNQVSIHHLVITNSVQAITNYNGSEWQIAHNTITGTNAVNGGGIGILVNAWDGSQDSEPDETEANNNVIEHNYTDGMVGDVGFSGPGICLSSGHGASQWPGGTLSGNIVYKNKCIHTGTNGVGFEVDDVPYELIDNASITANTVAFNDFRGSTYPFLWYGDVTVNSISRNFIDTGSNRGEGKVGLTPHDIFH